MKKLSIFLLFLTLHTFLNAQSTGWQWLQSGGGNGFVGSSSSSPDPDEIISSAIDKDGNLIVGGGATRFPDYDTIHFGIGSSWDNMNLFINKYDKNGNILWSRVCGGIGVDIVTGLDVDETGNIFVMGMIQASGNQAYINTPAKDTVLNNCDHFFARFDPNGNLVYIKTWQNNYYWSHTRGAFKRLKSGLFLSVLYTGSGSSLLENYQMPSHSRNFVLFDSLGNVVKGALIDTISQSGSGLSKFVTDEHDNIYFSIVNLSIPVISVLSHVYNPAPQYDILLLKTDTSFVIKDENLSGYYQDALGYLSYSNGYLYASGRNLDGAIFDFDTTHTPLIDGKFTAYKIDTNLNLIWASRPSVESISPGYTFFLSGASKDYLYLAYQNRGTLVWDSANLVTPANTYNMAMLKLRTCDGKCVKGEFTGGQCTTKDLIDIIKTDSAGNGYFMGTYAGSIGTHTDTTFANGGASSPDFFILKWGMAPSASDYCVPDTNCHAHFTLYPDTTTPHNWWALNQTTGVAPFTYSWAWGDGNTSPGATPSHTYSAAANYNICLTITDGTGCTSTYCDSSTYIYKTEQTIITVNAVTQLPTGIQSAIDNSQFAIFPNPASTQLFIQSTQEIQQVNIYNTSGSLVLAVSPLAVSCQLSTGSLSSGVYIAEIKTKEGSVRKRWLKM